MPRASARGISCIFPFSNEKKQDKPEKYVLPRAKIYFKHVDTEVLHFKNSGVAYFS